MAKDASSSKSPPSLVIVLPREHRESPFDLTDKEWFATRVLVFGAKSVIDARLRPDGYNLVWNVGTDAGQEAAHVHLHMIPRFADEPHAGSGPLWMLKQASESPPRSNRTGARARHRLTAAGGV